MSTASQSAASKAAAFRGFDDLVEIFTAGTHVDSAGNRRTWTTADLDAIVANHSAAAPAPIVIGHPSTDAPAYGWTGGGLTRVADRLYAKFTDVEPQFAQLVAAKRFPNRSVKIADGAAGPKLVHVGFLGAAPPAIEGLRPIQFASDAAAATVYEFAQPGSYGLQLLASGMRRLREFFIEKFGMDAADRVTPDYQIAGLEQLAAEATVIDSSASALAIAGNAPSAVAFAAASSSPKGQAGDGTGANAREQIQRLRDAGMSYADISTALSSLPGDVERSETTLASIADSTIENPPESLVTALRSIKPAASFSQPEPSAVTISQADLDAANAKIAAEKARADALEAQISQFNAADRLNKAKAVIAGHVAAGRLLPAQAEGLAEFRASIDDGATFEFAAADGSKTPKARVAQFDALLAGLPVQIKPGLQSGGDTATGAAGSDPVAIAAKASEYVAAQAKAGVTISIAEAVTHVSRGG